MAEADKTSEYIGWKDFDPTIISVEVQPMRLANEPEDTPREDPTFIPKWIMESWEKALKSRNEGQ